jgi:hypothetical protein
MKGPGSYPAQNQFTRVRLFVRVLFDDLRLIQSLPHILFTDSALKHPLDSMYSENQLAHPFILNVYHLSLHQGRIQKTLQESAK